MKFGGKEVTMIMIRKASRFKIIEISLPLCMFVAWIREMCHNTKYIGRINRVNYAYAHFSLYLDLKIILRRC